MNDHPISVDQLSASDRRALLARLLAEREAARPIRLTPTQKRMWLFEQLQPGSSVFHLPVMVRLHGPLRVDLLHRAFEHVVGQHDALRFRFELRDGEPVQMIGQPQPIPLPLLDLSGCEPGRKETVLYEHVGRERHVPFDLASGGLSRAMLFKLAETEHVLLVTTHHIVSDGWSMGIILREVAEAYGAMVAGRRPSTPAAIPQYSDFVDRLEQAAREGEFDAHIAYWKDRLSSDDPPLDLPTDYSRSSMPSFTGDVMSVDIGSDLGLQLVEAGRTEGVTLFVTMLAAFNVLLSRYSGQDSLTIGTPVSARVTPGSENLVGLVMNTVPIRTALGGDPTFRQLLAQVSEATRGALAHQALPFERILEAVHPNAEVSWAPLFQVMFNLLAFRHTLPGDTGGLSFELESILHPASRFDLTLYVRPLAESALKVEAVYRTDLFSRESISALLNRYVAVLQRLVRRPTAPISEISILTEEEQAAGHTARGLASGPVDHVNFPLAAVDGSIGARFMEVASRYPDAVAVKTGRCEWTYSELQSRAASVASRLAEPHLAQVERVGLVFNHDAPMLAALLGCLLAGRTYVPIDPLLPSARMAEIIEDAGIGALICEDAHRKLASELGGHRPILECSRDTSPTKQDIVDCGRPDSVAYLLYTSGSTGRPKGVMQSHRNVLHFMRVYTNNLRIAPSDRLTLFSTYGFDAAVMDIFGALLNGATLLPRDVRGEGTEGIQNWFSEHGVTIYHSTPTLFRNIHSSLTPGFPHSVRLVVLGGEEVVPADVDACRRTLGPACTFVNGLGPTESTVTLQNFVQQDTIRERAVPVGYPVDETEVLLLDGGGRPTDIRGEIAVRSRYVALGYWGRPDLTAAAFLPESYEGGPRTYRTGDLGYRRWDGALQFLGRNDDQVKIRGFRIELGEIQSVLDRHKAVRRSVAALYDEGTGDRRLVAYVCFHPGEECAARDLRSFVKNHLPDYMVPSFFVVLDQIPLTPTGKVNRRALPPPIARSETATDLVIPAETPTEVTLAEIWCDLLGVATVGKHDDFFALGGHSLAAAQLVSRIRRAFNVSVPLRAVFESGTLAGVAHRIDEMLADDFRHTGAVEIPTISRSEKLPLSSAQERLWFLHQLLPDSSAYHMAAAVRFDGDLDPDAFRRAWHAVALRHEALRTRIRQDDGKPYAEISDDPLLDYRELDLRAQPEAAASREALRQIQHVVAEPFDLESGPLTRIVLARVAERSFVHGVVLHHVIADHWSAAPLTRDLAAAYAAITAGRSPGLAPLRVQYVDYAAWQRSVLDDQELERQLGFWRDALRDLEPLELPFDRPRPTALAVRGARTTVTLSPEARGVLRDVSRREGVTLFMTLLGGFAALLQRYTGRDDLAVGSPVSNRPHADLEDVVGMFVNTVVLRCDLSGRPTLRELLGRVREMALNAWAHQDVPFERLVSDLHVARDVNQPPLVQVLFNVQNAPVETRFIDGIGLQPLSLERVSAQFDLSVAIEPEVTGAITAEYSADLFDAATIDRMLRHYVRILEAMSVAPETPVAELPMLSPDEAEQLARGFNRTACEYPDEQGLSALLREAAGRAPEKVAVVCGTRELTYDELDWRTAWLAAELKVHGVGANTPVAVCAERSPELVVALLSVLRAGAAYIPLDPGFPRERLSFMLADSAAPLVLTSDDAIDILEPGGAKVINISECWSRMSRGVKGEPAGAGEDLAYIIYTSGSTGVPKGVKIPQRALVNFLCSMRECPGLEPADVLLSVTTPSFDIFGLELYLPLLVGGTLVLATGDDTIDGARLVELLDEHHVTVMQATPATWRLMIDAGWAGSPGLRVLCGGESLSRELADQLLKRCECLWNLYGPTETTIWSAVEKVSEGTAPVSIGRPIANTELLILDRDLRLVPLGATGELFIGGAGLAAGYLNRPELDAERFVSHPFRTDPGARLYRTGDLGRRLPDGRIECLGRLDQQVKVRGFRIELGEIESVLDRHVAVRQSVASVYDDGSGAARLVAYVCFEAGQELTPSDLRRFARQSLPEYMVPSLFVVLEQIPLTPNGKVNRKALPPPLDTGGGRTKRVLPRTPMEQTVADVWAEVLGVSEVGIHDNFFDIGGHSLLSMQAIARLEERTGVRLNPARFIMDTLEQVSLACQELLAETGGALGSGARASGHP